MKPFQKTLPSARPFDDTVAAVEQAAADMGFRVLHVHDVAATLAEKGFPREPLKIVEVCNARYASRMLAADVGMSIMLPCPISVYVKDGRTWVSTMLPGVIGEFYPDAGVDEDARQVEGVVLAILEQAVRA